MKKILLLPLLLFSLFTAFSQTNQWTWLSGDNSLNQFGVYGTKGIPGAANKPGGRQNPVSWTDASGDLWLFGGNGYARSEGGDLNDLWKYTVSAGQWTWVSGDSSTRQSVTQGVYGVKGVPAPGNKPGARLAAVSWADAAGSLWLFGGVTYYASGPGMLNDLWKFTPATGMWTWVSGDSTINQMGVYGTKGLANAANKPGARSFSVSWKDAAGNLWLFGGTAAVTSTGGRLNDLWKYNPVTNQWTWVSGDNTGDYKSVYSTLGQPSAVTKPGSRSEAVSWTDAAGNLWLFGGWGYATSYPSRLNDLWRYSPVSNQWTWVNGDSIPYQLGVYGTPGLPSPANKPGSRQGAFSWTDASGNLWLFGGFGESSATGYLNDLWRYSPLTNQWTWVKGDNTGNQPGIYGTKGVPAAANKPGARWYGVSWTDPSGNLLLFGGVGYATTSMGSEGDLNDLWKYTPATGALTNGRVGDFTAEKQAQTASLSWTTTQANTSPFIVERYSGGVLYDSIGTVAAGSLSGRYTFIDRAPRAGNNFYRIRQVGPNRDMLYSAVEKVVMDDVRLLIVQNPVQQVLQVNIQLPAAQKLSLRVTNMQGNELWHEERIGNEGSSTYYLPAGGLTKGTYLIHIQSKDINITKLFIKR